MWKRWQTLRKLWKISGDLQIKEVGEKTYIFRFQEWIEKEKILIQQPWSFNKALVVFQDFDGVVSLKGLKLDWYPLWIQIHGLPLGMMNAR